MIMRVALYKAHARAEISFVRIALHRPYVLRRLGSERYNQSRTICFDEAIQDFQLRQAFKQTQSRDVIASLGWAYRFVADHFIIGPCSLVPQRVPICNDLWYRPRT